MPSAAWGIRRRRSPVDVCRKAMTFSRAAINIVDVLSRRRLLGASMFATITPENVAETSDPRRMDKTLGDKAGVIRCYSFSRVHLRVIHPPTESFAAGQAFKIVYGNYDLKTTSREASSSGLR